MYGYFRRTQDRPALIGLQSLMEQKHKSSTSVCLCVCVPEHERLCVYWTLSMPFKQQQTHGNNFDQQTCSKQEDNNEPLCSAEVS